MEKIDLHLHNSLSSDGESTFEQVVLKLKEKDITFAALTNHIPELPGHIWYGDCGAVGQLKKERDRLEDKYNIRVLVGAEIDVIDVSGRLAAPDSLIREFEFVISGVHRYPNSGRLHEGANTRRPVRNMDSMQYGTAEYYAIAEGVLRNKHVHVLVHPLWALEFLFPEEKSDFSRENFPEIYKREIMRLAAEEGKAVEINSQFFFMDDVWFWFGHEFGTTYSIGSDAHTLNEVGCVEKSYEIVQKHHIPEKKIIKV